MATLLTWTETVGCAITHKDETHVSNEKVVNKVKDIIGVVEKGVGKNLNSLLRRRKKERRN
jgi:hypothetical protein